MPSDFLHNHPQFADLIRIVAEEKSIDPALVEKDYWIMHCIYGLDELGFIFQLKGGTSINLPCYFRIGTDCSIPRRSMPSLFSGTNLLRPARWFSRGRCGRCAMVVPWTWSRVPPG